MGVHCTVLLETIFCGRLTLCILPNPEPTKLVGQPKQKPRRGGGFRQINTCLKFPLHINFLDDDILLWFLCTVIN